MYEADERVGRSILATGNGRCNFSNADVPASVYRNAGFVGQAMIAFDALADAHKLRKNRRTWPKYGDAVRDFFASLGLEWREEAEGRLYPLANKASSVLDVLRGACRAYRNRRPLLATMQLPVHLRCRHQRGVYRRAQSVAQSGHRVRRHPPALCALARG